jgi:hypothetical protein
MRTFSTHVRSSARAYGLYTRAITRNGFGEARFSKADANRVAFLVG